MTVSTRVQYGARLMFQLALSHGSGLMFLKDIARREGLSEKYLSLIVIPLRARGLVVSGRGMHGGYQLAKAPGQISMREIVCALEGDIAVARPARGARRGGQYAACLAKHVWRVLDNAITHTLAEITLASLLDAYHASKPAAVTYEI